LDVSPIPQELTFIDEAGFNLAKTRRRGRNIIGQHAIIEVLCLARAGEMFSTAIPPLNHTTLPISFIS
jgi:hypothetical protein